MQQTSQVAKSGQDEHIYNFDLKNGKISQKQCFSIILKKKKKKVAP